MGAWGTKIYQNDTGSDVKDDYKNKLKAGKTEEETLKEILEEYEDYITDSDDRYDFWFALADTMWSFGRLTNPVKEKALELIELEGKEGRWETEKEQKARNLVLEELKHKLLSDMPAPKKISVYKPFVTTWKPGDVYVYKIKNPPKDEAYNPPKDYQKYIGWYITFYVHGIVEKDINLPGIPDHFPCLYLMLSEKKPVSINELNELTLIFEPFFTGEGKKLKNHQWLLFETSNRKYPKDLEYLGECKDFKYPEDEYRESVNTNSIWWNTVEIQAIRRYELAIKWQQKEFADGVS